MKKFLYKLALFAVIIIICDFVIGRTMDYVVNHITVGGRGRDNYICNQSKDDVLIFGSSRAVHHYNSLMIEDSLGLSCYNCGDDGNGIILGYGRLLMIEERHIPKIIIYDINPSFDYELNNNTQYLGWLKPRYDREGINKIFDDVDYHEQFKMMSKMYRYNSIFFQNIFTFLTSISNDTGKNGFRPLEGELDPLKIKIDQDIQSKDIIIDSLKIDYIRKFIELSKESHLFFVVSPIWYGMNTAFLQPIEDICREKKVTLLDYSNSSKYVHNEHYFRDGVHMNSVGADEFTNDLIHEIRKELAN